MPEDLPNDPELLKQMLAKMQSRVGVLEEQVALLRQRLFARKSEQTVDPATPQMALFNEAEYEAEPAGETSEEEVVAPAKRRGKRKPLPADLPRIEVIHELPEHELTCACGCPCRADRRFAPTSRNCWIPARANRWCGCAAPSSAMCAGHCCPAWRWVLPVSTNVSAPGPVRHAVWRPEDLPCSCTADA